MMSARLPLENMTTEEKLQAMEELWADLTRNEQKFQSPAWHEQVLREREKRLAEGDESFIDWEQAKKDLRELTK